MGVLERILGPKRLLARTEAAYAQLPEVAVSNPLKRIQTLLTPHANKLNNTTIRCILGIFDICVRA
jgi:hypothetical protein